MTLSTRLALILYITASVASHAQQAPITPEQQQIEASERAVGKAVAMRDFPALEKLWSPQMLVNSPGNNILSREQVFNSIREDKLKYSGYTNEVEAFRLNGDIAILMGNESLIPDTGPEAGTRLYRRYTDIWQRTNGSWSQIARQATYIDPTKAHYYNPQKSTKP